ncbi:MAG: hypothetical protein U1F46_13800 [Marinagarivorans sp.]
MKFTIRLLVTLCSLSSLAAAADDSCKGQTPMELSYCTLIARGATGLPALYEFRKNSPATQYLLLKRPAAKFAVVLPAPAAKAKPIELTPTPEAPQTEQTQPARAHPPSKITSTLTTTGAPSGCQLANETISCGNQRFRLQWNKPKAALTPEALAPGNQLVFPPEPKDPADQKDYLVNCFALYVQKMLLLGLGNTTLSFDKFAAIYATARAERFDFAARFESMYHFLKEERKTLQPPKGFGHSVPARIDDCQPINDSLWSCQTAEQHWVFAKT